MKTGAGCYKADGCKTHTQLSHQLLTECSMMEMLLARDRGMALTTAAGRSRRAAEAGVAGRLSRSCGRMVVWAVQCM